MPANEIRRRQRHPIVQRDVLILRFVVDIDAPKRRLSDILDVVTQRPRNETDVAFPEIERPRLRCRVKNSHPRFAFEIILPFVGIRVPMEFAQTAGFNLNDERPH